MESLRFTAQGVVKLQSFHVVDSQETVQNYSLVSHAQHKYFLSFKLPNSQFVTLSFAIVFVDAKDPLLPNPIADNVNIQGEGALFLIMCSATYLTFSKKRVVCICVLLYSQVRDTGLYRPIFLSISCFHVFLVFLFRKSCI